MNRIFLLLVLFFAMVSGQAQTVTRDTAKVKKPLIFSNKYYNPCDHGYSPGKATVNEITIDFSCHEKTLTGTNKNGKVKWKISTRKWKSPLILEITEWSYSGKKYDVLLKLQDGSYMLMKSKSGKMKRFEKPG